MGNNGRGKNRGTFPGLRHFEGQRGMLDLWDGTRKSWQALLTHTGLHKTHTKWLVHSWSTFGARTNHKQHGHTRLTTARTWGSHHLPPYSILYGWSHGLHPNGFFSRDSRVGISKSPKSGLLRFWGAITLRASLWSRCNSKQSCSYCWEISNDMLHALCSQVFWVDS
jgi:hypothetical protein